MYTYMNSKANTNVWTYPTVYLQCSFRNNEILHFYYISYDHTLKYSFQAFNFMSIQLIQDVT